MHVRVSIYLIRDIFNAEINAYGKPYTGKNIQFVYLRMNHKQEMMYLANLTPKVYQFVIVIRLILQKISSTSGIYWIEMGNPGLAKTVPS